MADLDVPTKRDNKVWNLSLIPVLILGQIRVTVIQNRPRYRGQSTNAIFSILLIRSNVINKLKFSKFPRH